MKPAVPGSPDVIEFLELWGLSDPIILKFQEVDPLYTRDNCHISVKHRVKHHNGKRVHGWALWQLEQTEQNPRMVLGNFHSVWQNEEGTLIDVTPPKCDAPHVLFVPNLNYKIIKYPEGQVLYNTWTNLWENPFLDIEGKPTSEAKWIIANDEPCLLAYCNKLGLTNTDMS